MKSPQSLSSTYILFVSCSLGLEEVLREELKSLGATIKAPTESTDEKGGVHVEANQETFYRICLRSQVASRVLMPLKTFSSHNPAMLYTQTRRISWENYIPPHLTFAVDCILSKSTTHKWLSEEERAGSQQRQTLNHSHATALKIKDAICDRVREEWQDQRPNIDSKNPDVRVHAYVKDGKCTLSLDAVGFSLHERGYRVVQGEAPLKENLAAACVRMSGWEPSKPLYDPFCGSGTFLIEAALMADQKSPHLPNRHFGVMTWPDFNKALWDKVQNESTRHSILKLYGTDEDPRMVSITARNAERARVKAAVNVNLVSFFESKAPTVEPGIMIMNPPYGERMGEASEMPVFYKKLGDHLKHNYKGWQVWMLTGNKEALKHVGLRTSKRIPVYNGPIECRLVRYDLF